MRSLRLPGRARPTARGPLLLPEQQPEEGNMEKWSDPDGSKRPFKAVAVKA